MKSLRITLNKAFLEKLQTRIIFPLRPVRKADGKSEQMPVEYCQRNAFPMRTAPSSANMPVIIAKLPENKWVSAIDPTVSSPSCLLKNQFSDLLLHLERGNKPLHRYRRGFTAHLQAQAHVRNLFKLLSPEDKEKTSYVDDIPATGATEELRGIQVLKLVGQTGFEVGTISAS